jgi:hypothetical protein
MPKHKLFDNYVVGGNASVCLDLSGNANSLAFDAPVEVLDVTTFANLVRKREAGLGDSNFSIRSQMDEAEEPRATLEALHGDSDAYYGWIESNASMAEGDYGLFVQALASTLERTGELGQIHHINISGNGNGHLVVGRVLQQDESLTVTGASTGFQFGALAAGETMRATMFVLGATAGTLDMLVESDDNSGFTSATTRMTFSQFSAIGAEQQSVAGAVTDDYWRVSYTIATGPFTAVVIMGKE